MSISFCLFADCKQKWVALLLGVVSMFTSVYAADAKKAPSAGDLAKASQNPVASMISVPFENNATFNNGPDDVFVHVLNVKPVIPMGISENWNLINRAIIPIVNQHSGLTGQNHVGGATISGGTTEFTTPGEQQGSLFGLGGYRLPGVYFTEKSRQVRLGCWPPA